MRPHIPEDLSGLPDAGDRDTPQGGERPAEVPEDLADLPDTLPQATEAAEAERAAQQAITAPGGRGGGVMGLLVTVALVGLVVILLVIELRQFVMESWAVHPAFGWASAGLATLLLALMGLVVGREARAYFRLASFAELRATAAKLRERPRDAQVAHRASDEVERFVGYMEATGEAELLVAVQRLRERMAVAESPVEWVEDLELVLLRPMDEEAWETIRREAINVGVGTALSPSGLIDAVVAVWRNVRLVRKIAGIYHVRPGAYGTYVILRRTLASAALADLAQEASVALLGTTRSVSAFLGGPLAQGMANAIMTIRIGLKAQEQCRPVRMGEDRTRGTVRMMLGAVGTAVRRIAPEKVEPRAEDEH